MGLTYRFAPNVAFDLVYAYMWAGSALDQMRVQPNGTPAFCGDRYSSGCNPTGAQFSDAVQPATKRAEDVWKAVARVRVTF